MLDNRTTIKWRMLCQRKYTSTFTSTISGILTFIIALQPLIARGDMLPDPGNEPNPDSTGVKKKKKKKKGS